MPFDSIVATLPFDFRALTPLFYGHINPYGLFELDLEGPSFLEAA